MELEAVGSLSGGAPVHHPLPHPGDPRLGLLIGVEPAVLLLHLRRGLQAQRHLLLGGDAADVLLFLGDGIEDAAAEVAEQRDGSDDEGHPESAARHGTLPREDRPI